MYELIPEEYIPPSLPTLCNLTSAMFHFGVDFLHSTQDTQHDLSSLASPKGEMTSSFSWTSLFKSPRSTTLCFGGPTLAKLNQVKLLCETEFCPTKPIPFCNPVVHTGTIVLLTSKTLPHKPNMYLQDEHSTPPSEEPLGDTEETTSIHLTMVYKSLSHNHSPGQMEMFKTQGVDKATCLTTQEHLKHAWGITSQHSGQPEYHTNTVLNLSMLLTQVPSSSKSTFYPGSKLSALLDHIFAGYSILCLIDAHGKTSLLGFHQVPLDPGIIELLQPFCENDSYDIQ